jgi:hypothetical protein
VLKVISKERMTIPICLVQFFTRRREDAKDREECKRLMECSKKF